MITKDDSIEDIVTNWTDSGKFFFERNIRYIKCGEVSWDSLGSLLKKHDINGDEIDKFIEELNEFLGLIDK